MTPTRAWITYALLRLAAFAVPFVIVMLVLPDFRFNWVIGGVVGVAVGLAVSEIFLRRQRIAIGEQLEQRREQRDATRAERRSALEREEDADVEGLADGPDVEPGDEVMGAESASVDTESATDAASAEADSDEPVIADPESADADADEK